MIISLIPSLCDEYEASNPIVVRQNNEPNNNENSNAIELENINIQNIQMNMNDNLAEVNPNQNKNTLNDFVHSQNSAEKVVIKSSNDTRLVNPSEDQNNKFRLVEENESRTENEFVFSEKCKYRHP